MNSKISDSLPWPLLVGAKFLQVHPVGTICAILLALPGQLALIASFLLPIKIIMLMASEGMPNFMPSITADMDKKMVISLLAGLSITSFAFHHLANKTIQKIALSGVSRIERRNQKLHLFEGQEELTRNSYTRYIDSVASANFVLLGTALLFVIYPEVAITFLTYIAACIIGTLIIGKTSSPSTASLMESVQKNLPTFSGIGFFIIFSLVLIDYVFFSIPNNFIALLLSIIIGRQILSQTSAITTSIFFFNRQKQKLKALLFHGEVFRPTPSRDNSAWAFLDSSTTSYRQLLETVRSTDKAFDNNPELNWQDSGIPGVIFLIAENKYSDRRLLIKVFDKKRSSEARHEAALLLDAPETLPCPKLVNDTTISGLNIHIVDITGYLFPLDISRKPSKDDLKLSVSMTTIPNTLLSRYIRSHSMLWDQLGELQTRQFELISKEKKTVSAFLAKLPRIQDELKRLPLRLFNPHLLNTNIYAQSPTGEIHLLHWGRWSLDPLGANLGHHSITSNLLNPKDESKGQDLDPMTALLSRQLCQQTKQQLLLAATETMKKLSK